MNIFRRSKKEIDSSLLDYYVMSMASLWETVKKGIDAPEEQASVAKIENYLANPTQDWVEAYKTEQLIVPFMSEAQLDIRYVARLSEAKERLFLFNTAAHELNWKMANDPQKMPESLAAKRAAFQALLDEIQWEYINRRLNRRVRREAAVRLWAAGVIALIFALLPWLIFAACGFAESLCLYNPENNSTRTPISGIYTTISFGLLGALFSRMNSFRSQASLISYVQLTEIFRSSFLLMRLGFGMVGSLVLYFMFAGEFLSGNLFPRLEKIGLHSQKIDVWNFKVLTFSPNADLARLIVWSFIGGFSERLVPSAIEKAEAKAGADESKDKKDKLQ